MRGRHDSCPCRRRLREPFAERVSFGWARPLLPEQDAFLLVRGNLLDIAPISFLAYGAMGKASIGSLSATIALWGHRLSRGHVHRGNL
jgi:hypothetical protein